MFNAKVRPVNFENSNLLAFADVTIQNTVTVRNVRIIEGQNGVFVSMPSKKGTDNLYHPVCTIAKEHWQAFNDHLIEEYNKAIVEMGKQSTTVSQEQSDTSNAQEESASGQKEESEQEADPEQQPTAEQMEPESVMEQAM